MDGIIGFLGGGVQAEGVTGGTLRIPREDYGNNHHPLRSQLW